MEKSLSTKVDVKRIFAIIMALVIVAWTSTQPQAENDFWLLAKIGERTLADRAIPSVLEFPFTEAQHFKYNAHEWLAALLFHALATTFAENSLALVLGSLGVALFVVVARVAYIRSNGQLSVALAAGILALLAENYRHFLRPELLTLFYLLGLFVLLERQVQSFNAARLGLLFMLVVLWANTHGSFVLSVPIAAVFTLDRLHQLLDKERACTHSMLQAPQSKPLLCWMAVPLVVLLGTLCTPFGTHLWQFSLGFTQQSLAKRDIAEWMLPFDERSLSIIGMYPGMAMSALLLGGVIHHRNRLEVRDVGIALMFVALGMLGNRFMVYQGLIFAWIAPSIWRNAFGWSEAHRLLAITATCIALLFLANRHGNMNGAFPYDARSSTLLSPGMVMALQQETDSGNVFNSYDLGGELIYRGFARLRPSIDSRIDSYGDAYYFWHESLLDSPKQLQAFLLQWSVRYMLLTSDDFSRWKKNPPLSEPDCAPIAHDTHVYLLRCH